MNAVSKGRDNPSGTPDRPTDVERDGLERAIREVFSRQAATPHTSVVDPAEAVIRRANRIQRRRALTGMGLAVTAVIGISAGVLRLGQEAPPSGSTVVIGKRDQPPQPTLSPATPDTGAPLAEVDLVLGQTIATAQGRRVGVVGADRIERAHRLSDDRGWLAISTPGLAGRFLWAVAPTGAVQVLLAGADEIVLDADGNQVAWKQGSVLASARIVNGELAATARAEVPTEAMPLRFVGGAVLVRLAPDRPGHTLWRLHPGVFDPGTDRSTDRIFGALPDGRLVGEIITGKSKATCLALLDPARDFAATSRECGPPLGGDGLGSVSPDGRWLLANGRAEGATKALLVDLTRLDGAASPVVAGPPISGAVTWSGPGIAYYHADDVGRLVRVDADQATSGTPPTLIKISEAPAGQPPVVVSDAGYSR